MEISPKLQLIVPAKMGINWLDKRSKVKVMVGPNMDKNKHFGRHVFHTVCGNFTKFTT